MTVGASQMTRFRPGPTTNLSRMIKRREWQWQRYSYFTGPGGGIQLQRGAAAGRLR